MYQIRKLYSLICLALVLVFFVACASTRPVIVASYEALGSSLVSVGKTAKILCEEGKIPQENCTKIKTTYNMIRQYYIDAGDVYKKVIETGSDEDVKNYEAHIKVVFEGLKKIEKYITPKEE